MGTENKRTLTSQARLRVHLKLFTHSKSAASKQINFDQIVKKNIQHSVKQPHKKPEYKIRQFYSEIGKTKHHETK